LIAVLPPAAKEVKPNRHWVISFVVGILLALERASLPNSNADMS